MRELYAGIEHFYTFVFPGRRELFQSLAHGQNPKALFVTCSDSRIVPGLLTQTEPGDLFVTRNPGNLVPAFGAEPCGEAAALEYAVEVLSVTDIVICGHSCCGAMQGLMHPESLAGLPAVRSWVGSHGPKAPAPSLPRLIRQNVLKQLTNVRSYPAVSSREKDGKLRLHGWVYEIESGRVLVYDPAAGDFSYHSPAAGRRLSAA
jgi:carbonic anhydrase